MVQRDDYNAYMREYVKRRYKILKAKAVAYKGGKCIKCGYDRCLAAMAFHHRDPKSKELDWGLLRKRSWMFIITELDKCDLLCHNCHSEIHNQNEREILEEAVQWIGANRRNIRIGEIRKCSKCCNEFQMKKGDNKFRQYCSVKCSRDANSRGSWPNDDKLLELALSMNYSQLGKMFGVSHAAVKKRLVRIRNRPCSSKVEQ